MELVEAIKSGDKEAVKEALESGADLSQQDKQGWTPLNWAAGAGQLEIVELLLQHGANPLAVGRDLRTPQMIALAAGHAEVVKALRKAEAGVDGGEVVDADRRYCTAYHLGDLRRYPGWTENKIESAESAPAAEGNGQPAGPADTDVVFLHQDYKVTKSIWPNEDVIFDNVTDEWKAFCTTELAFVVPDSLDLIAQPATPEASAQTAA